MHKGDNDDDNYDNKDDNDEDNEDDNDYNNDNDDDLVDGDFNKNNGIGMIPKTMMLSCGIMERKNRNESKIRGKIVYRRNKEFFNFL